MFPSRPATAGKHFRLLAAVLLAAGAHGALVIVKFAEPPVTLPAVSLPRSVSVFLGQQKTVETPVPETEQVLPAAETVQEREPVVPLEKPVAPVPEKVKRPPEPQIEELQPARVPAVEEVVPPVQQVEPVLQKASPEINEAARTPRPVRAVESPTRPVDAGVSRAGTVQEAYPHYRLNDPPPYPRLARKRGQQGTVILQVLVNREGRVDDLQVEESSGYGLLDRAAFKAVRKWRFEPGRRGDVKVKMRVRVPVTFTLE